MENFKIITRQQTPMSEGQQKRNVVTKLIGKEREKKLQFLPYGRSIGSWICLTHKTYTCHTVQNITDMHNIVTVILL
jgi:hypothetical protein